MNKWFYESSLISNLEDLNLKEGAIGYCYCILNNISGKMYIGKKNFYTKRKKLLIKKERSVDKRKKVYKHIVAESDWINYWSSSKELQEDVKSIGEGFFTREILRICYSSKELSYYELKYMMINEVLERNSYNGNVAGKFWRKDLTINHE